MSAVALSEPPASSAAATRVLRSAFRRLALAENFAQVGVAQRSVHAVAAQQITVVRPQGKARVVEGDGVFQPHRATQDVAIVGASHHMVFGQ